MNENNIPVPNVSVFVNNQLKIRKTDETGFFHLNVQKNDTVSVRKDKAKDQYIVSKLIGNDTTIVIFQLYNKSFLLEEITLTGSRVKKIDGEKNERVVDYYVYPDESFITIKEFENNYFLDLFVSGSPKKRFKLPFQPTDISNDCKNNFLIHSADSVYETWMDETLHFSNVIPKWQFEGNIKNLVYCGETLFMDENYGYMNRKYTLNYFDKDTSYSVYSSFDTLGYYTIYEQISSFKAKTTGNPRIVDSIPLKYQYTVNSQNRNTTCSAAQTMRQGLDLVALQVASKLNVQSERVNLNIVTVDFSRGCLFVFTNTGKQIHTAAIEGKDLSESRLIRDPYTDKFYVTNPNKAMFSLSKLNIENGNIQEILNLREVSFPEKVRVFNNKLYFIAANSNGFKKIYSVDLEKYATFTQ